ncbi:MGMT family protein [Hoyosella altamirensis]|uniref:Alkylated DNA nucleotide flippase Atl1 n=1 Tax=Hoyosella altamirensis TaxID=616997 RepID=A0A839RHG5_9ACTN|nr:MGMT family protein [Hoyosella altamirensis]MBB3035678.1 alkylated DNA nucleotide flippase Atl1 [Hoyosella altamirensis]
MTPAISDETVEHVRELVSGIAPGCVATYGDIATAAGLPSARIVGWILKTDGADIPWHRVVRADGILPAHLADKQAGLLAREGVHIVDGRVRVAEYRHDFSA